MHCHSRRRLALPSSRIGGGRKGGIITELSSSCKWAWESLASCTIVEENFLNSLPPLLFSQVQWRRRTTTTRSGRQQLSNHEMRTTTIRRMMGPSALMPERPARSFFVKGFSSLLLCQQMKRGGERERERREGSLIRADCKSCRGDQVAFQEGEEKTDDRNSAPFDLFLPTRGTVKLGRQGRLKRNPPSLPPATTSTYKDTLSYPKGAF